MPKTLHDPAERAAILARTDALRPDAPRRWGRMNAHQAVCHMADGYRMALGDRPIRPVRNLLFLTAGRWVALNTPLPWPKGAPTSPKADQVKGGGTPPGDFDADVRKLRELTERFAAADPADLHPHVIFGRLSRGEWGRWAWRHADHHLRQFGA